MCGVVNLKEGKLCITVIESIYCEGVSTIRVYISFLSINKFT